MNFSNTTSLLDFMSQNNATALDICESKSGGAYVSFGGTLTAMLAKKVGQVINATNVNLLQVSYIDGVTEDGVEIKGNLIHTIGERKVLSTFSLADIAVIK
jgi:hypothetical protein